ncbi:MAG: hypothetical protein ACFE95_15735, partial [Candidatus Hodarchaeota archaeon]
MRNIQMLFCLLFGSLIIVNLTFVIYNRSYPIVIEEKTIIPVNSKIETIDTWGWTTLEILSTESTGNSYNPRTVSDQEGNLHVVWEDYTNLNGDGS